MEYSLGGTSNTLVSPILPGDKIQTTQSVVTKTGVVSIDIKDITRGWNTGTPTRTEPIDVTQVGEIDFWLCGNSMPSACANVPLGLARFTTLKTTGDTITLGPHHGSIGSFLGVSSDFVTKYSVVDNVGTVETRPSTISTTSSQLFDSLACRIVAQELFCVFLYAILAEIIPRIQKRRHLREWKSN